MYLCACLYLVLNVLQELDVCGLRLLPLPYDSQVSKPHYPRVEVEYVLSFAQVDCLHRLYELVLGK